MDSAFSSTPLGEAAREGTAHTRLVSERGRRTLRVFGEGDDVRELDVVILGDVASRGPPSF
jgi:hypothetical protein